MDYGYYTDPPENYSSEGDIKYAFDDSNLGPAQAYTYSGDLYDHEIENSAYMHKYSIPLFHRSYVALSSPSPNWQNQEMQYYQGHTSNSTFTLNI